MESIGFPIATILLVILTVLGFVWAVTWLIFPFLILRKFNQVLEAQDRTNYILSAMRRQDDPNLRQ